MADVKFEELAGHTKTRLVTKALMSYLAEKSHIVVPEVFDPALLSRIDLFAVKTDRFGGGYYTAIEVKTSKPDLLRELQTDKNQYFKDSCNYFYLAVPWYLVKDCKELFEKSVGIYSYNKLGKIRCVRKAFINMNCEMDHGLLARAMRRMKTISADEWDEVIRERTRQTEEILEERLERRVEAYKKKADQWDELTEKCRKMSRRWGFSFDASNKYYKAILLVVDRIVNFEDSGSGKQKGIDILASLNLELDNIQRRIDVLKNISGREQEQLDKARESVQLLLGEEDD